MHNLSIVPIFLPFFCVFLYIKAGLYYNLMFVYSKYSKYVYTCITCILFYTDLYLKFLRFCDYKPSEISGKISIIFIFTLQVILSILFNGFYVLVAIELIVQHIREILLNRGRKSEERHVIVPPPTFLKSPGSSPSKRSNTNPDSMFKRPH